MTQMRFLIFFFLLSICKQGSTTTTYQCDTTASCGCSTPSTLLTRIVGGESAVQGSWSWAVSLRSYGSHFCGGSILSPLFIVTAAHCVEDITDSAGITILAGSVTLVPSSSNKVYQTRSIAQIYQHPNYDPNNQEYDIALLRLSSPLNMASGNLKPICLPTGSVAQPPDNINMVAVGWGVTVMSSDTVSPILRQVTVQSISETSPGCQSLVYNSQQQFCAGLLSGGKDTCQGDSGGPIMAFVNGLWQLNGLTSYGDGCALANKPGVYTRVSFFIGWIKSITQPYEVKTTTAMKKSTTTSTTKKPTTTTSRKKLITTKKRSITITSTTGRKLLTTTTHKKTTPRKLLLETFPETRSNETDHSIKNNLLPGTVLQASNNAEYATVQSLFVIFFLPVLTSAYSFILLFLV